MTTRSKPRSIFSLAISGLLFTSLACSDSDERKVDRQVDEMIQASEKGRRNPTPQNLVSSLNDLTKAAGETGASLSTRIKAKAALAQAEYDAAQRTARELANLRPAINRAMWDISQTADQITALNISAKAAAQTNPQSTLKTVADKRAEMVTAGEAASKKAAEFQGEIDKIKGQIATLTQQRDAAKTEADSDADQATKLADKEAAPILEKVGETRRKAANIGHDIDKLTASLFPLERDLAIEQGKKRTADEGVAALDQQGQRFNANWQAMQQRVGEQNTAVQKLGNELDQQAQALAKLVKDADALRATAGDQFQKSADHYAAAASDALKLSGELRKWSSDMPTAPEKKAWDSLEKTYNSNVFKLYEAESRNALGNLHAGNLMQLQNQAKLAAAIAPALQDAKLTVPASLTASLKEQIDATKAAADKQYAEAAEKFINVYQVGTNPKDVNHAAHIARIFALYGQYLNGDKGKLGDAKTEAAETFSGDYKEDPIIRALPAELGIELKATTPTTGTSPTRG